MRCAQLLCIRVYRKHDVSQIFLTYDSVSYGARFFAKVERFCKSPDSFFFGIGGTIDIRCRNSFS